MNLDMVGACRKGPLSMGSPPHASGGVTDGDLSILEAIPDGGVDDTGEPREPRELLPCSSSCKASTVIHTFSGKILHSLTHDQPKIFKILVRFQNKLSKYDGTSSGPSTQTCMNVKNNHQIPELYQVLTVVKTPQLRAQKSKPESTRETKQRKR